MSAIKDMVQNPHWIHTKYCAYWDFLLQSYEGGIEYNNGRIMHSGSSQGLFDPLFRVFLNGREQQPNTLSGNLFPHPKERTEDYNRRVQMSYYYNFCAPIIDIYSDHMFKQAIIEDFEELEDTLMEVGDDIDQQGSSITEFRKQCADMAQIYGHCFVIIDSPSISMTDILTRKDQIENRAFPYLTIFSPQNVINWALDKFGNAHWVLVREVYEANDNPMMYDKNKKHQCLYRLWTRDSWVLYNEDYEEIASGVHALGVVPIVCVFDKKSKQAKNFLGVSSISDIAFISRDIYNACSELRQILRDQTFAFLALQGTSDEYSEVALGTGKGLLYPPERNAPQYVSPPSENANIYFQHIDRQVMKIFQMAKLEGGTAQQTEQSAGVQSGVSKAWDFNQTNSALSSKTSSMEDAEMRIWRIFGQWLGIEWSGAVQYPNEFSVTSLNEDLDEAEKIARLDLGTTFNLDVKKSIMKKKFPRKTDEDIEEMISEVEKKMNQPTAGVRMAQRITELMTATGGKKQEKPNADVNVND